jgi:transcription termination factor NusB
MKFRSNYLSLRIFNLSLIFIMLMGFSQCISPEDDPLREGDSVQELMEELKKLPTVEDADPMFEEPDYGVLFGPNLSLDKLEKIGRSTAEGKLNAGSLEILEELMSGIDPGIKALLGNVNPEFLLELMDPENELDPELLESLEKMLLMADFDVPQVKAIGGLIDLEILKERIERIKSGAGSESFRTADRNSNCAAEVFAQFGSGARDCSFREQEEMEKIYVNYSLRMDDAELRFIQRNLLIKTLYKNRLVIKAALMADLAKAVNSLDDPIQQEKVKMQITYLGLMYATYIRMHLTAIYEGGLSLNHLYFQKEVELITDQKENMEEEIRVNFRKCLDQVNKVIIELTEERCPGEEPYTY